MIQRYHNVMSKFAEIAVDLLSKIIKYSSALKEAKEKIPAQVLAIVRWKHLNLWEKDDNYIS